jgi:c-di-GMP-binding flagellar brake protein YcgR
VSTTLERRLHPRVKAPVLYRPAGGGSVFDRQTPHDVSLGGLRVDTSQYLQPGERLDVELLLPDQWLVISSAEVVWINRPGANGEDAKRFQMGLRFVDMAPGDRRQLATVLSSC